jgi:tetratricopeptide (TPR) repeat protein
VWSHKGDDANAVTDLSQYLRIRPDDANAYYYRGWLRKDSSPDEAMEDFQAALRLNPRHVGAFLGRAEVWKKKGDFPKAIADATAAIDIAPESADLYERRARIRMDRGEHNLAIDDLTAALRIDPKDTDTLLLRALEWICTGEPQKALKDCRAALAIDPKKLMAYYYMATAHSQAGQKEQALKDFDAALEIDPDDTNIRYQREYELFTQGRFDQVLADLDELIKKGKHVADAYAWRAYFRLVRQEWDKAAADYTEAIRMKPDQDDLLSRRAMCRLHLKEFDKALQDADDALRLDPTSEEAVSVRRQALAKKVDPLAWPVTGTVVEYAEYEASEEQVAQEFHIELRAPNGLKLLYERPESEQFGPSSDVFPVRLPMHNAAMMRFQIAGVPGAVAKALYARLESKQLSGDDIEILRAATPTITLTKADLDAASSGRDVTKTLVLRSHDGDRVTKPQFVVVSSTDLGEQADPVAVASRHGTPVATLRISTRLPPLFPVLPDRGLVALCLQGPQGLRLAHVSLGPGRFDDQPLPVPAHFALLPGTQIHFKLSGPPVDSVEPIYALLTLPQERPATADWPANTELPVTFSKADLEAAAAGKIVTCVFYLVGQTTENKSPSLQTLSSAQTEPGKDPIAEATAQGTVVAILKLSTQLTDLPSEPVKISPEVDSAAVEAPADGKR